MISEIVSLMDILDSINHSNEKFDLFLDIDNTFLKFPGILGSDQWFKWKTSYINDKSDFDYLRNLTHFFYFTEIFCETEIGLGFLLSHLVKEGKIRLIFVTARDKGMEFVTRKHINAILGQPLSKYELILCSGQQKINLMQPYISLTKPSIFIDDTITHLQEFEKLKLPFYNMVLFHYVREKRMVDLFLHMKDVYKAKYIRDMQKQAKQLDHSMHSLQRLYSN